MSEARKTAEELINKIYPLFGESYFSDMSVKLKVIECALITTNEVIDSIECLIDQRRAFRSTSENEHYELWQGVKKYLENL